MFALRKLYLNNTSVAVGVPRDVRTALGVEVGDHVAWRVFADGRVELITLERLFPPSPWPVPSHLAHGTVGQGGVLLDQGAPSDAVQDGLVIP